MRYAKIMQRHNQRRDRITSYNVCYTKLLRTSSQLVTLRCVLDRVIPGDDLTPGAGEAGGAEYIDRLLGAFNFDPPQIWAGGPTSGRRGGAAAFDHWIEMGEWEKLAWRTRIDQWSLVYEAGLLALGDDFVELSPVITSYSIHYTKLYDFRAQ